MAIGNNVPDKTLLKTVTQKLLRTGSSSSRITPTVRSGDVTLAGVIGFEHERRGIVRSVSSIPGVRRVIDQLRLIERKKA
ncbi:MAG: BON domain-containing protein [Pirellulaceae bacterium]